MSSPIQAHICLKVSALDVLSIGHLGSPYSGGLTTSCPRPGSCRFPGLLRSPAVSDLGSGVHLAAFEPGYFFLAFASYSLYLFLLGIEGLKGEGKMTLGKCCNLFSITIALLFA